MADTTTTRAIEEMRCEIDDLRHEMARLRRIVEDARPPAQVRRSPEEQLASLERIRELREGILRRRGGVPLPPSADDIALAREERAEAILRSRG